MVGPRGVRKAGIVALFLLPSAVPLLLFTIAPMFGAAWISLHSWNLQSPMGWAGLDNYRRLRRPVTAPVHQGKEQLGQRRHRSRRAQHRVRQFEQRVRPPRQRPVELPPEAGQPPPTRRHAHTQWVALVLP